VVNRRDFLIGSAGALGTGVGYITTYGLPADYKPIERGLTFNKDGSQNTNVVSNDPYPSMGMQYYWWNTLANNTVFTQDQLLGNIKLTASGSQAVHATAGGVRLQARGGLDSGGIIQVHGDILATGSVEVVGPGIWLLAFGAGTAGIAPAESAGQLDQRI